MRLPEHVTNPCLAVLVVGGGFSSLERFAVAVNVRGWHMHGVKLTYDHVSVKRWLQGGTCQNPDVVAAVLSEAWGIPIPVGVIWPDQRDGTGPIPAHQQPWAPVRTLEELGVFLRSDMLTRRDALAGAVTVVSGPALLKPLERWLGVVPGRLTSRDESTGRIGTTTIVAIEQSTRSFAATDAEIGGALSREAAVGQLKYAVDLARHASYSEAVGNRLLAAIAELSGMVGWMCHDSGMPGPAQRYFVYGLQAARESTDPRARILVVSILSDMANQQRWLGRPQSALKLVDLAISQLPADRRRYNVVRAVLTSKRVENGLCHLGAACLPEIRSSIALSHELHHQADDEERAVAGRMWHRDFDMSDVELAGMASAAYLVLTRQEPSLAPEAEALTQHHLSGVAGSQRRNSVFSQIRLASIRFVAGEPEQACTDGDTALAMAEFTTSHMVQARLREMLSDSEPYREQPRVREFRERLQLSLVG
jgi:hypothetical protein